MANVQQVYEIQGDETHEDLPISAATTVAEGDAVSDEGGAGTVRPLDIGDTPSFEGFALRAEDNSAGAAGDKKVRVRQKGNIVVDVTGASALTNYGAAVYATGPQAFTLTAGANTQIGKVVRWISDTKCVVRFEATAVRSI